MGLINILILWLLFFSALANAVLVFRYLWISDSRSRRTVMKLLLSMFSLFFVFLALELSFYLFVHQSDAMSFTLSSQRWLDLYWKPLNSQGYRDVEHTPEQLAGKKVIVVVGDSNAAGMGTQSAADRFSNVLGDKLGPGWVTVSLAKNGWNTVDEFAALRAFPGRADVVVLSYFPNDIEGAANKLGFNRPAMAQLPNGIWSSLVMRSHFINFVYWRLYRFRNAREMSKAYYDYVTDCYAQEEIWKEHTEELRDFMNYTLERKSKLIVLLIPHLTDIEASRPITAKVAAFLRPFPVQIVDLTDRLAGRRVEDLVAHRLDGHPGVALHHEIGQILYEEVQKIELQRE